MMVRLILRDVRQTLAGGAILPALFMLLVATLYPFAIGPDAPLLRKTGAALLWVAALLAALLPVDQLLGPDIEAGVHDQLVVRGLSDEIWVVAKGIAHWLTFGPLVLLAVLPAAALLDLSHDQVTRLEIGLLMGTPGLAALALLASALTLGLKRASALAGLLVLPLAVPLLIFGASSLLDGDGSALKLLAATSLFLCSITPFAAGAAVRAGRA